MVLKIKKSILDIAPYKGGLSKTKSGKEAIKLSSNETPLGASPKAIKAYKEASKNLHRYPDGSASKLRKAIGEVYDLNSEQIVCGAGSDELISLLCIAYASEGDEIIHTKHGFLMYPISAKAAGATPINANQEGLDADIDAILSKVTDKTRLIFIANPNNPTGGYIPNSELKRLRENLRDDILLIIDGAYAEYVSKDDFTSSIELVDLGDNTVVTRTFSKIYGLASLRIGWAYCPPSITDILNRVRGPFNISTASIEAATAAVKDIKFTTKTKEFNDKWLSYLSVELQNLGLKVHPSVTNFLLVEFEDKEKTATAAYEALINKNIIVRPLDNYGLPNFLRISVGLEKDNKKVVEVLKNFLKT